MVLYTPLVDQDIFPAEYNDERTIISYEGRLLHVSEDELGHYRIEQLLSTNPADFLNASFSPGRIINHK